MSFWSLIGLSTVNIVRVTQARKAKLRNEEVTLPCTYSRHALSMLDELLLFLMYLSLGSTEMDLADRFGIHHSTVSRIVVTWANYLYILLGSVSIWMSSEDVKAVLPKEFSRYPDTQAIIDCTKLRCQQPASLPLHSEMHYHYKSHCTLKGLLGMAPHGAVTFVSKLYAGSISDKELSKQSGLFALLTEDMAEMADKGFLIDDCVPGKVYQAKSIVHSFCLNRAKCQQHMSIKHKRLPISESTLRD
uniref:DDE Tnp4 domain-containing protein n=1 Tax=Hucho hucho TaxID=62062 RepID=A0A4W5PMJ2_9TELE